MKLSLATAILTIVISGCAASGTQVSQGAALQFKEGVSTESQIVSALGRPTSTSISSGLKFIVYSGMQYKVKGATFIPIVGAFAGGADYTATMAMYQIGPDGVLQKITYTESGTGTRSGATPAYMPATEPIAVK